MPELPAPSKARPAGQTGTRPQFVSKRTLGQTPWATWLTCWQASRPFYADGLALLAGALMVLAYAPFALRPLAIIAPALLFALWATAGNAAQAGRRGLAFGLGQFGLGISWVYLSIHDHGGAPVLLAALITLALVGYLALFPALLGRWLLMAMPNFRQWRLMAMPNFRQWLLMAMPNPRQWLRGHRPLGRHTGFLLFAVAPGWVIAEWLRGWLFTGFPWLLLGHSQVDTWLGGYAPLVGEFGVGLVVAWLAALLAAAYLGPPRHWPILIALASLLLLAGLWLGQIPWTRPQGEPLQAALVQGNLPQAQKWDPAYRDDFAARYRDLTLDHLGADLILWPESALPVLYHEADAGFFLPLAATVGAAGGHLLTGVLVYDVRRQALYNSLLVPGAGPKGRYDKRHLVPFGEYVPFGLLDTLGQFLTVTAFNASPGHGRNLLMVDDLAIAASVCFEVAFGTALHAAFPEAVLLVNISNDAWFGRSIGPHQHLEIARMRALETGRPLLRATNNGITAHIDVDGTIAARLPQFTTAVLSTQVQPHTGQTPYVRFGNLPVLLLLFGLGLGWKGWSWAARGRLSRRHA